MTDNTIADTAPPIGVWANPRSDREVTGRRCQVLASRSARKAPRPDQASSRLPQRSATRRPKRSRERFVYGLALLPALTVALR